MTDSNDFNEQRQAEYHAFLQVLSPETDPVLIELMGRMRTVSQALRQTAEKSIHDSGVSEAQYRILRSLLYSEHHGDGTLTPSELSRRHGTSRNTISSLIRNLEDAALIERHLDAQDKRKFKIELTDAGRDTVNNFASRHFAEVDRAFSGLTQEEQQMLSILLKKLGASASNNSQ